MIKKLIITIFLILPFICKAQVDTAKFNGVWWEGKNLIYLGPMGEEIVMQYTEAPFKGDLLILQGTEYEALCYILPLWNEEMQKRMYAEEILNMLNLNKLLKLANDEYFTECVENWRKLQIGHGKMSKESTK